MLPRLLEYMDILIAANEVINMSRRLPCRINVITYIQIGKCINNCLTKTPHHLIRIV